MREFADAMASALVAGEEDVVYDKLAPVVKRSFTQAEFSESFKLLRYSAGRLSNPRMTRTGYGTRALPDGSHIPHELFVYDVHAQKMGRDVQLHVHVTDVEGRPYLSGWHFMLATLRLSPPQ